MKPRKRYYSTTTGHATGIDIAIRRPDGGVIADIFAVSVFGDDSGTEKAKANAKLIVDALNAYRKGG